MFTLKEPDFSLDLETRLLNIEAFLFGETQQLTADGPIATKAGNVQIMKEGSPAALTLAAPHPHTDNGKRLVISALVVGGHSVASPGLNGDSSVATFSGAEGEKLSLVAANGAWYLRLGTSDSITLT